MTHIHNNNPPHIKPLKLYLKLKDKKTPNVLFFNNLLRIQRASNKILSKLLVRRNEINKYKEKDFWVIEYWRLED